jgi:hypothetical protein
LRFSLKIPTAPGVYALLSHAIRGVL